MGKKKDMKPKILQDYEALEARCAWLEAKLSQTQGQLYEAEADAAAYEMECAHLTGKLDEMARSVQSLFSLNTQTVSALAEAKGEEFLADVGVAMAHAALWAYSQGIEVDWFTFADEEYEDDGSEDLED